MADKRVLLGSSIKSPVDNKTRKVVVLPGSPSKDFILKADCRIIQTGRRVSIKASDLPGDSKGTYEWSTTSSKLRLINTVGSTLVVEALDAPGSARDSESIQVVRTDPKGSQKTKVVMLTIADVTINASTLQLYGFDDFDTPSNRSDDHVSVESEKTTFVAVEIKGGAVGSDFDFVCDNPVVCTADVPPALAIFDLKIQAKAGVRVSSLLKARIKCPSADIFAKIMVHVYSLRLVNVLIAKISDNSSPTTVLRFPNADYTSLQLTANDKLKEAVVKFDMKNFDLSNGVTNIPYDVLGRGALSFDINEGGGYGFNLIDRAILIPDPDTYRVVVVKELKSYYYLDREAKIGDTSLRVRGLNIFLSEMKLGLGTNSEIVEVTSNTGNLGQLAVPLSNNYPVGTTLEFYAAAWSTDPIILAEGAASLDTTKWTILHEVGHRALELQDIIDVKNIMHFDQGNTDNRLRFCPRISKYTPGDTENQWEKIPRSAPPPTAP